MGRKRLMVLNAITVITMTSINVILGLLEIKFLIQKYGSSVNGLIQTGNQLLSYLTLFETGITGAYLYSMYKPVAEKDTIKISSLYRGFVIKTRKAVVKMLVIALILSLTYPLILKKNNLSYSFMVIVYSLLSIKVILPYLISIVPRNMIVLQEQRFKVELITGFTRMLTYISEIFILVYTKFSLPYLLLFCIVISMLSGLVFHCVMNKMYGEQLRASKKAEDAPTGMSKDVTIHTISRLIFNGTDNIVISALGKLSDVTIYSNYNLIVSQVSAIANSVFDGASASIGIKIARNEKNTYEVYRKILGSALLFGGIITSVFITMINEFVGNIWVGQDYEVSTLNCYLFGFIMYAGIVFSCLVIPRNAKGLYKESKWFTILQCIMNLVITVVTVPSYGITGALFGTFIARIFITVPCNYYIVQHYVFPDAKTRAWELPATAVVTFLTTVLAKSVIANLQNENLIHNNVLCFILDSIVACIICGSILLIWFIVTDADVRKLVKSVMKRIKTKLI